MRSLSLKLDTFTYVHLYVDGSQYVQSLMFFSFCAARTPQSPHTSVGSMENGKSPMQLLFFLYSVRFFVAQYVNAKKKVNEKSHGWDHVLCV